MVFFSHKVDICNNKDVIDGVPPDAAPPATTQMSPKLDVASYSLILLNLSLILSFWIEDPKYEKTCFITSIVYSSKFPHFHQNIDWAWPALLQSGQLWFSFQTLMSVSGPESEITNHTFRNIALMMLISSLANISIIKYLSYIAYLSLNLNLEIANWDFVVFIYYSPK